jgi:hypothetical protein
MAWQRATSQHCRLTTDHRAIDRWADGYPSTLLVYVVLPYWPRGASIKRAINASPGGRPMVVAAALNGSGQARDFGGFRSDRDAVYDAQQAAHDLIE